MRSSKEIEADNDRFDRENAELKIRIKALVDRLVPLEIGSPEWNEIDRELEEISSSGQDANSLVHYYYYNAAEY